MFSVASRPVLASPRRAPPRPPSRRVVLVPPRLVRGRGRRAPGRLVRRDRASSAPSAPRPDGFGFSAAGMIFPYRVGAWEVLIETGLLTSDAPVAGASAGALVAAIRVRRIPRPADASS